MHNTEWSAALGISALLAIIMLTSQSASANMIGGFNCFGEPRCVSGWNYAINDAQTDWNSGTENTVATSTYENTTYGIQVQYPSDWTIQQSNASGTLINIATFISPTGPNSNPTADVAINMDNLHNSTTNLNNYARFIAFNDYENRTSYHAFKLLELSTNSTLAGKPAYTIIGTYDLPSSGLQKIMEIGSIIGDKAYSLQYIADAPKLSGYLPAVQKMIDSLQLNQYHHQHLNTETNGKRVPICCFLPCESNFQRHCPPPNNITAV